MYPHRIPVYTHTLLLLLYIFLSCAPGGKLLYVADLQPPGSLGTVTGVDISRHRLSNCRSLIKKYKHDRIRLYHYGKKKKIFDGFYFYFPFMAN